MVTDESEYELHIYKKNKEQKTKPKHYKNNS